MYYLYYLRFVLVIILLQGCYLHTAPPEWVKGINKDASHHPSMFITAVGIGDTRNLAKDNAIAEIAKVFRVKVESESKDIQIHESTKGMDAFGGNSSISKTREAQSVEQITKTSTDKLLTGVLITEYWFDKKDNRYYALAVLDKTKKIKEIYDELELIYEKLSAWIDLADSTSDLLTRIRYYYSALEKIKIKNSLHSELRIVDADPPVFSRDFIKTDLLIKKYEDTLAQLKVGIIIEGPQSEAIKVVVVQVLNNFGFSPVDLALASEGEGEKGVHLIIKGSVAFKPLERQKEYKHLPYPSEADDDWSYIRGSTEIRLINRITKEVIKSITVSNKEGHLTKSEAENRSLRRLIKETKDELTKGLNSFLVEVE